MFEELEALDEQITRIEEALIAAPRPFKQGRNLVRNTQRERPWWKEELHPRGRDGRFIQNGGYVRGDFKIQGAQGEGPITVKLARVQNIVPNPNDPNDPLLQISTGDGRHTGYVRASEATDAPDVKARLNDIAAQNAVEDGEDLPEDPGEAPDPDQAPAAEAPAEAAPAQAQQIAPTARSNDEDVEVDNEQSASEYAAEVATQVAESLGLSADDPQVLQMTRVFLQAIADNESLSAEARQKAAAALENLSADS